MPNPKRPKVAYLFGAGATHAEIIEGEVELSEIFTQKHSLLIGHLSERVIKKFLKNEPLTKEISFIKQSQKKGNIELLISLVESNNIPNSEEISKEIKEIVRKEIQYKIGYFSRKQKKKGKTFYLHKALLEFHRKFVKREELIGLITLNYDDILDKAYEKIHGKKPNYCLSSESHRKEIPILKLHGSFNWTNMRINGRQIKKIPIMPLGAKKNYLEIYYSFVWGRTLEILAECDILRVVGCSLNEADWGLMDLLFKANLCNKNSFDIQIIDFDSVGMKIKDRCGFLPFIKSCFELEYGLLQNYGELEKPFINKNVFKKWLTAKVDKDLNKKQIKSAKYIKRLFN